VLVAILDQVFAQRPAQEWVKLLKEKGDFILTPVNSVADLPADPQVIANSYIVERDHPVIGRTKEVGLPVQFSKTPGSLRLPAPELGQDTEQVLTDIAGYTWEEVETLRRDEVI